LPETAAIEAEKVTSSIRSAVELSWQLQRADARSTCRKQFTKLLAEFSPAANRLYSSTPISQKSENRKCSPKMLFGGDEPTLPNHLIARS
jgi:hypothetical protein